MGNGYGEMTKGKLYFIKVYIIFLRPTENKFRSDFEDTRFE